MKITKRTTIGITLIVLIGLASWGLAGALTEQQYINLGKAEYPRGNYDAAIYLFTCGLEVNPDNYYIYNDRGLCYLALGDKDKAIEDFTEAIDLKPDFAGAYYNRGLAYFKARGYENAIADYNKSIGLDPDNIDAYYNRGLAYNKRVRGGEPFTPEHMEFYGKALADFDTVLALDPEYALAHAAKGGAIYRHDDYENATAEFDIAVNSAEWILQKSGGIGLAGVYKSRGRNYKALRDYNKSIENYNMAMNYNPVVDGHQIGNYKIVGDWNKAIELYDMRLSDPTYTSRYSAYYGKGDCYCQLGLYDEAMEMYDEAEADCKANRPARLYSVYEARGGCYCVFEEYDNALEMYNKAADEYALNRPDRLYRIYVKVGDLQLELEDYDGAIVSYNKSIAEGKENLYVANAYKGLGIAYKGLGETEKARAALEKAIELYEEYGEAGHGKEENIEECQKLIAEL